MDRSFSESSALQSLQEAEERLLRYPDTSAKKISDKIEQSLRIFLEILIEFVCQNSI